MTTLELLTQIRDEASESPHDEISPLCIFCAKRHGVLSRLLPICLDLLW